MSSTVDSNASSSQIPAGGQRGLDESKAAASLTSLDTQHAEVEAAGVSARVRADFQTLWPTVTTPDRMILFGFRRFRTSHLLNLRFLEQEIAEIDQTIFQAGLRLGDIHVGRDRLALSHAASLRPNHLPPAQIDEQVVKRLRTLLQQYDDGLAAFNRIMTMETLCLADHAELASQSQLTREEMYRTRLLVVDRPPRTIIRDPIQHAFRKALRWLAFRMSRTWAGTGSGAVEIGLPGTPPVSRGTDVNLEALQTGKRRYQKWPSIHVAWLADVVSRLFFGILAGALLIGPIATLMYAPSDMGTQLAIIALFTWVFTLVVALTSRASPQETMAASAAYAAVLVVFVSNTVMPANTGGRT